MKQLIILTMLWVSSASAVCPHFPADNIWNMRVDGLPVHPTSGQFVANIGAGTNAHPDFGHDPSNGIPLTIGAVSPNITVNFDDAGESDPSPYVIGTIESGSDAHSLYVNSTTCTLYEIDATTLSGSPPIYGGFSGAIWNLNNNNFRQLAISTNGSVAGITSADAAGLPIGVGLVRYDEVSAGAIDHALRFTAPQTHGSVWPGSHVTRGNVGIVYTDQPPLGSRFRLKASFDISSFSPTNQVILQALKTYGMILADNGGPWYISGSPDARWNDSDLSGLGIKGVNFEMVDESCAMVSTTSYKSNISNCNQAAPLSASNPVTLNYQQALQALKAAYGISP